MELALDWKERFFFFSYMSRRSIFERWLVLKNSFFKHDLFSAVMDRSLFELNKLLIITALVWMKWDTLQWKHLLKRKSKMFVWYRRDPIKDCYDWYFCNFCDSTFWQTGHDIGLFFTVFALLCVFFLTLKHFCVCCSQLCFQMKILIHSPWCHRLPSCIFCSWMSHKMRIYLLY